jgi:hypothetical protein
LLHGDNAEICLEVCARAGSFEKMSASAPSILAAALVWPIPKASSAAILSSSERSRSCTLASLERATVNKSAALDVSELDERMPTRAACAKGASRKKNANIEMYRFN